MALSAEMDRRLRLWAEHVQVGDGSGYPVKSTLHPDWSPPSPGITPTLKVSRGGGADRLHRLVQRLPDKMRAVVVARYILKLSDAEAGLALNCAPGTVPARLERAHRELLRMEAESEGRAGDFCNIEEPG